MTSSSALRMWPLTVTTACVALAIGACTPNPAEDNGIEPPEENVTEEQVAENPIPQPEHDSDDTVRLPIGLVSPAGHDQIAPIGEDGRIEIDSAADPAPHLTEIARTEAFGCGDMISVVETVPIVTEDPAATALEYLLSAEASSFGNPAFLNALSVSETLEVDSVETTDGQVTVELSGEPQSRSYCESWQVLKQIETTARVTTGSTSAEILVDSTPLAQYLGLEAVPPLEIIEINRD